MDWLNFYGAIIGGGGAVGAAIAFLRYGSAKAIIELLKEENEALKSRLGTMQEENISCKQEAAAAKEKATILQDIAQQTPSIEKLTQQIADQHATTTKIMRDVVSEVGHLAEVISQALDVEAIRPKKGAKRASRKA